MLVTLIKAPRAMPQAGDVFVGRTRSNFPNPGITLRHKILLNMMNGKAGEILLAGYETLANEERLDSVTHLSPKGYGKADVKSRLPPITESYLYGGEPNMVESKFGVFGMAICFEALFTGPG